MSRLQGLFKTKKVKPVTLTTEEDKDTLTSAAAAKKESSTPGLESVGKDEWREEDNPPEADAEITAKITNFAGGWRDENTWKWDGTNRIAANHLAVATAAAAAKRGSDCGDDSVSQMGEEDLLQEEGVAEKTVEEQDVADAPAAAKPAKTPYVPPWQRPGGGEVKPAVKRFGRKPVPSLDNTAEWGPSLAEIAASVSSCPSPCKSKKETSASKQPKENPVKEKLRLLEEDEDQHNPISATLEDGMSSTTTAVIRKDEAATKAKFTNRQKKPHKDLPKSESLPPATEAY